MGMKCFKMFFDQLNELKPKSIEQIKQSIETKR